MHTHIQDLHTTSIRTPLTATQGEIRERDERERYPPFHTKKAFTIIYPSFCHAPSFSVSLHFISCKTSATQSI